ncbi:hypothetical protein AAG570_009158 [Ranatra chinensis]|uniref:Small ribosomal subunit protein uS15m n=1 Tax=Ranatra chinensis TaxID=642074 RepID=A0ABD0YT22_9HEMI
MKSPVPIKWVRPVKVPCTHPEKSGDLQPLKEIDLSRFPLEFRDSEELKSADDNVKRILSLEFFNRKNTMEALINEYKDSVKRHILDEESPEVRVAVMTAYIRDMQRYLELNPKNKLIKVRLKESIDKRKKLLKNLRTWDYKCFEWILEKLGLIYKPMPPIDVYRRVERKRSLRMLTTKYCEDIVSKKFVEYKEILENQQESFLEEKIKTLEWIMKEEKYCGVNPTVTPSDIEKTKEDLENLKASRSKK